MNINCKWGFYVDNKLLLLEMFLNTDFEYYQKLKELLKVYSLPNNSLVRIGGSCVDGHYLLVDAFKKNQIAYSFGINNDVSWDNDMADRGYKIFMYDHTIDSLPAWREEFNWSKEGLSGTTNSVELLDTLENYIKRNGHSSKTGMILKIDIEGAEWDFLDTVPAKVLRQFDQIVIEFHDIVKGCEDTEKERRLKSLQKLNDSHRLVHVHGNNTNYVMQMKNVTIPNVLEATYVNKEKFKTVETDKVWFPTPIDLPNDPNREDVLLGNWNEPLRENLYDIDF